MDEIIPQRELRNRISAVLRAAEQGATYTVTVDGRPVAELGPHRPRRWVPRETVADLWDTPTDERWLEGLDLDGDGLGHDPWTPR